MRFESMPFPLAGVGVKRCLSWQRCLNRRVRKGHIMQRHLPIGSLLYLALSQGYKGLL